MSDTTDVIDSFRRFALVRKENAIFPEQVGVIAVGAEFPDGRCVLRWLVGPGKSTVAWDSIEDIRATHLHEKSPTELVWVD